jgi:hypothetical protein
MALSNAERQRLYIQRLKAKAAANAKQALQLSRHVPRGHIVTNEGIRRQIEAIDEGGLSTQAKAKLKRLARHKGSSVTALIERWATAAEHRLVARLTPKALKAYYDGK